MKSLPSPSLAGGMRDSSISTAIGQSNLIGFSGHDSFIADMLSQILYFSYIFLRMQDGCIKCALEGHLSNPLT